MFSIAIPTLNNFNYLKITLESLKKNSKLNNEIIVHVNEGNDGSLEYLQKNNYLHTFSKERLGVCSSTNSAAKLATKDYILYSHDDMYFLPDWDQILKEELLKLKDNLFYLSGTMMGPPGQHIEFDCGDTYQNFDEKKLLQNYKNYNFYDHQGTHWAPHLIHRDLWNKIGGFSNEFDPGIGSDPDLNMKLWNENVRYFKGINNFKTYHFGSISLRKKDLTINKGNRTFLRKWGITPSFFKKHYLQINEEFKGPLTGPKKNLSYYIDLFICKVKIVFFKLQK
jgi:glycosyltransferase involved in cell wall biosynthesis